MSAPNGSPRTSSRNKQRGFYSDFSSALSTAPGAVSNAPHGETALSQTMGRALPFAYSFKYSGGGPSAMSQKLHAHNQHAAQGAASESSRASRIGIAAATGTYNPYSDVPDAAVQPKVFVAHDRETGSSKLPRKVAVERKRREYAAIVTGQHENGGGPAFASSADGLEALLREKGVDYRNVSGGDLVVANTNVVANPGAACSALLPLAAFDNTEWEIHQPQEWIKLGIDRSGIQRGVPGLALDLDETGKGTWKPCRAIDYDSEEDMFKIVWTNLDRTGNSVFSEKGEDDEAIGTQVTESPSIDLGPNIIVPGVIGIANVLRIHLCFAAEDPASFASRLAGAFQARRNATDAMRYSIYIDCMPKDGSTEIPESALTQLVHRAISVKTLKDIQTSAQSQGVTTAVAGVQVSPVLAPFLRYLLAEVQDSFARSMNKLMFDNTMSAVREAKMSGGNPAAAAALSLGATAGGIPTDLGLLAVISVPPPPASKPVPEKGLLPVLDPIQGQKYQYGAPEFQAAATSFYFCTLLVRPEIITLLTRVAGENMKVWHKGKGASSQGMLVAHPGKSCKPDDLEAVNNTAITAYSTLLRDMWASIVRNHVRLGLGNVGKGNYNLKETNSQSYMLSKLRRLLKSVDFRMADELRYATIAQITEFAENIEASCSVKVEVHAPNRVISTFPSNSIAARRPPLYSIDVVVKEELMEVSPDDAKANAQQIQAGAASQKKVPQQQHRSTTTRIAQPQVVPMRKFFSFSTPLSTLVSAPPACLDKALNAISGVITIERQVMDRLFWPEEPYIPTLHLNEEVVVAVRNRISNALTEAIKPLEQFLKSLDPFLPTLQLNVDTIISDLQAKFAENGFSLRDCQALIAKHKQAATTVLDQIPVSVPVGGIAVINAGEIRSILSQKHKEIADAILQFVSNTATESSQEILRNYDSLLKQMSVLPTDIESLTALREFLNTLPEKVSEQVQQIENNESMYDVLHEFSFQLSREQFDSSWRAKAGEMRIWKKLAEIQSSLQADEARYAEDLATEQAEFEETISALFDEVNNLNKFSTLKETSQAAATCYRIRSSLEEAESKMRLFNSREALFGQEITNYDRLSELKKNFEPFLALWDAAHVWQTEHAVWMSAPFTSLNAEAVERDASNVHRTMVRSIRIFERMGLQGCANVAKAIRDEFETFKPLLPLLIALRNPGMRDRHWEELSKEINCHLDPVGEGAEFTLAKVSDLGLSKHIEVINKIGEKASREYQLEVALDKMSGEWTEVLLDVVPYKETGAHVLTGIGDIQALLDEHINMTQAMSFSAFKKPWEERIDNWLATLYMVSEVLEEWVKVQRAWMYLQPIFDSADIQKQLPAEYKRFSTVDKTWRSVLTSAKGGTSVHAVNQKAIQFCNNAKLLERWQEANRFLDTVQKGLSDYLETKRAGFSRFYFLSNDELLEILSQTKDPRAVQPHLKKCFEGVKSVNFTNDAYGNPVITSMVSDEKEVIELVTPVDPKGKNVEVWMSEFEVVMTRSVRKVMFDAIADYLVIPRTQWVQKWPGQVVLNGSQTHWTRDIEEGIKIKKELGVKECYENQLAQLRDIVLLIRGKLSALARITLGSLTVIDVHARDVTKKMAENGVAALNDFEWISQMRYYWLPEYSGSISTDNLVDGKLDNIEGDLWTQMVSSNRPYGYEYLGNSLRLVITPLTDKCYMTLMGALQMNLGGAPAGPAGTGKTETTKDLAKALAKYCVVFNCSDGLDYLAMGKFFKGLASCGAWACFDEFNRIDVEVLSVVAQQVLTLQEGVRAGAKRLVFEGTDINLNPQFAAFITMNPGYAGRSELPDNLKALFRPVAMMVPDYALIGEIMLYSFGFEHAFKCAAKMVATFKLCSEQLSSQDHYDYGMRAVKTVITAAGNLKSQHPDQDEELLLYRALSDVNLPKFLAPDLPLFHGIMSDLFPTINKPEVDHGDLLQALTLCTEKRGLQPVPHFITKCVQLYEMVIVRHGLMMVGPAGGGKSCMLKVTRDALTLMANKGRKGPKIAKTQLSYMNPKSITLGQLYGKFDENTHEWTNGILPYIVEECVESNTPDLKWVVFDGPVDAVWIENMNTVLDDNKKLCLVSGKIISLTNEMTIMFEVEDLAVASPATVSRCGMVYTEPTSLGYDPIVQSWIQKLLPTVFPPATKATIQCLFDTYMRSTLYFLRRYLEEPVATSDNALVQSVTKLMNTFFEPFSPKEGREPPTPEALKAFHNQIPAIFMFSLVWGAMATVGTDGRRRFDAFLKSETEMNGFPHPFPNTGSIYDFAWDTAGSGKWVPWMSTIAPYEVPKGVDFSEILVPTKDSTRNKFLARVLLLNRYPFLLTGPTGVGKSVNLNELLSSGMSKEWIPLPLTFSAQTSANQTQDIIDSKMDKRQRSSFGPPMGNYYVLYVDDLNMPQKEVYGAQPPIELLRQFADYGGWYDRKELTFRHIVDTVMLAAMGHPGGGRNPITARFVRHFVLVNATSMDDESMRLIFNSILSSFLSSSGFDTSLASISDKIVQGTIRIYNTIVDELLPTPAKPHYTFNLRDLSKVFQGLLQADPKTVLTLNDLGRMWIHEVNRVFVDRLVNQDDTNWFNKQIEIACTKDIEISYAEMMQNKEIVIFGDFMVPGSDIKVYKEIDDIDAMQNIMYEYLNDYNSESKNPMKLVLFIDALKHVARIARIIRQPGGNALLLGVGGSGRQSLTRLATYISGYELATIEITKGYGASQWREDMRRILKRAGIQEQPTVFLFSDTSIVFEGQVEDLNNILNSGDIPNLYPLEDEEEIAAACKNDVLRKRLPPTKINIMSAYLQRVRKNIHCVVCFSPMGEAFRNRLRMFPALVNCTTIDWFAEWPEEALRSVANTKLTEGAVEGNADPLCLDDHLPKVVEFIKYAHQTVADASVDYAAMLRRHNYVTPTSYLELLSTFDTVLNWKRKEVGTLRSRLQTGLDKITSTENIVANLQEELVAMQPVLEETQKKVQQMIIAIDADKANAAVTKSEVEQEELEAQKKAAITKEIADGAAAQLAAAEPALAAALLGLKNLERSFLDELRTNRNPTYSVKLVAQAVCILFDKKPIEAKGEDNKRFKDYWATFTAQSSQLICNPNKFLDEMMNFKKDEISAKAISELKPLIDDTENFSKARVEAASVAAASIFSWIYAMYQYYNVSLEVAPKREALRVAQASLDETMTSLAEAQMKLKAVEDKIAQLEADFDNANAEKERLAKEVDLTAARLERAHKLLSGLGGEKGRWTDTVAQLSIDYDNLIGDSLVASAAIAYLGAFTPDFRGSVAQKFRAEVRRLGIPHSDNVSLISVLADPVQVRAWTLLGLPSDQHSIENGIIMDRAHRWPLLIDPQGQANRYIRNMAKETKYAPNGIEVLRMSDRRFLQGLENCIRFGKWCLIANIGETIDAALEPVLLRLVFKQGGADMIRLGESNVPYNNDFRLFMTTTLPNPHYNPETQVKVSLLNFTLTPSGLEDQLLGEFVVNEMPELEERKSALMLSNAKNKAELVAIETKILELLSSSTGNILDDEMLINTLGESKVKAEAITIQVSEAEATEKEIDTTRESYRPVAFRASLLYFTVADLTNVDPMYQYSLLWFTSLFVNAIRNSPHGQGEQATTEFRIKAMNEYFTYSIYKNVCRSLFEIHKPLFSLLVTIRILEGDKMVDQAEWKFILSGLVSTPPTNVLDNPDPSWISQNIWSSLTAASTIPSLIGLDRDMTNDPQILQGFKAVFDANDAQNIPFPGKWANLEGLARMCVLKCIRPDKLLLAAQDFVVQHLGKQFVEPPPFDLEQCYEDSTPLTPLIFVLTPGSDPTRAFFQFADTLGMRSKVDGISLGQGQGAIASRLIEEAFVKGSWVLLQNCHLASSWMPELERIVEAFDPDRIHRDFRLWLTSLPSASFPVSVLQNGVKMTNEPPTGLRANIKNFYYQISDDALNATRKPEVFRKLLFGLAFFHAVVQERKRFGPLGWNRPYDFGESDRDISMRQMEMFLDEYDHVPYRVLNVLTAYINYGGRVTDDKDNRTIDVILRDYFCLDIVENENYKFTPSGVYYSPTITDENSPNGSLQLGYMAYIDNLPLHADPEVFGMHANANMTCELAETDAAMEVLLSLQPKESPTSTGEVTISREDRISNLALEMLAALPPQFDIESISMQYPVMYSESMNTVLVQECMRYNKLTAVISKTLFEASRALKGLIVMSRELDEIVNMIELNRVPAMWEALAYPSLKPLSAWMRDLLQRLTFLQTWISNGTPNIYWISGFFFPQAFLTGTLQNYARKISIPIDTLSFSFEYIPDSKSDLIDSKPEFGCYIRGLYLEGAKFNQDKGLLEESTPKQLYTELPVIHLLPVQDRMLPTKNVYRCPVYKILSRWGVLATTGHSSNFIMWIELPTDAGDCINNDGLADCAAWIKAGVAAFTQLRY